MNYKPGQKVKVNISFHPCLKKDDIITLIDLNYKPMGSAWKIKELLGYSVDYIYENHITPISQQLEFDFKE